MAVTVLDCDVITPGPYSLNWGAPGIKDVFVYIYMFIYLYIDILIYIHFQVNYCLGIAIIVVLELSFDSAFLCAI